MSKVRCIGLDVHADTIAVAIAEPSGEVRYAGPNVGYSGCDGVDARRHQAPAGFDEVLLHDCIRLSHDHDRRVLVDRREASHVGPC